MAKTNKGEKQRTRPRTRQERLERANRRAIVILAAAIGGCMSYRDAVRQIAEYDAGGREPGEAERTRARRVLNTLASERKLTLLNEGKKQWQTVCLRKDHFVQEQFSTVARDAFKWIGLSEEGGVTVADVASACDVSQETIKNWFNRQKTIPVRQSRRIQTALLKLNIIPKQLPPISEIDNILVASLFFLPQTQRWTLQKRAAKLVEIAETFAWVIALDEFRRDGVERSLGIRAIAFLFSKRIAEMQITIQDMQEAWDYLDRAVGDLDPHEKMTKRVAANLRWQKTPRTGRRGWPTGRQAMLNERASGTVLDRLFATWLETA